MWPMRTLRTGRLGTGALTPIGSSEGRSGPNQSHFLEYRSLHESRSERPLRARCGIWRAVRVPHAYPVSQAYRTTALAPIGTSSGPSGVATGPLFCLSGIARKIDPIGCDRRLALGEAAEGPSVRVAHAYPTSRAHRSTAPAPIWTSRAAGHRASGEPVCGEMPKPKCGTDEQTLKKTVDPPDECGTALIIIHN